MRIRAKIDANQRAIVTALRSCGVSVVSLATVGDGVPDLLVGYKGETYIFECKDGTQPPSKRQLTKPQKEWHAAWRGKPVVIVTCVDDALRAVGALGLNA